MSHSTISRRQLLKTGAAGAGILAMSPQFVTTTTAKDKAEPGYIDAHVHVWTPDTKQYPLAEGYKKKDMKPASFTPEELFSHCKPSGVSRIVLIQMSFYQYDNSYMIDMMKKHKGIFSGVAVIDENDSPDKMMKSLAKHGVRGLRIRPWDRKPDQWLGGDGMKEMWKCGASEGLAMCHLIDAKFLPSIDQMCRKYPTTPVVIDHFARIGVDGKIRKSDLDNLCALAKHKTVSVKISAYYALGKKKAPYNDLSHMIRRCLDAFGPERLMWASDGPFQVVDGHEYEPSIDLIKSGLDYLTDSDRQWLLRKTAERVFFS